MRTGAGLHASHAWGAKSIPTVVIFMADAPIRLSGCLTPPLWHVDAV